MKAIVAPGCAGYSRKQVDELVQFVAGYGLKGLAHIAVDEDGVKSSIAKFLTAARSCTASSQRSAGAKAGRSGSDCGCPTQAVPAGAGGLATEARRRISGLVNGDEFRFLWVVDFPLFS